MAFNILARAQALSPTNLTIREQARLADNPNDTRWQAHAPTVDVNSTRVRDLEIVDTRFAADFRAWNADGREIPEVLGPQVDFRIKPMTATKHLDEERLQEIGQGAPDLVELRNRGILADVNQWPTILANAVDQGFERAWFQGWVLDTYTVMDPKTGSTVTATLSTPGARRPTEGTAWGGAVNEWDRLLFHIGEAQRLMGSVGGFRIKRADLALVIADAPNLANGTDVTFGNIDEALSAQGYGPIRAVIDDRTIDTFTDGGSAYTTVPVMPVNYIAFFPANGIVGRTPVVENVRAYTYVARDQRVNFRDVTTFYVPQNNGATLLIIAERIGLPVPFQQFTYVVKVR